MCTEYIYRINLDTGRFTVQHNIYFRIKITLLLWSHLEPATPKKKRKKKKVSNNFALAALHKMNFRVQKYLSDKLIHLLVFLPHIPVKNSDRSSVYLTEPLETLYDITN